MNIVWLLCSRVNVILYFLLFFDEIVDELVVEAADDLRREAQFLGPLGTAVDHCCTAVTGLNALGGAILVFHHFAHIVEAVGEQADDLVVDVVDLVSYLSDVGAFLRQQVIDGVCHNR